MLVPSLSQPESPVHVGVEAADVVVDDVIVTGGTVDKLVVAAVEEAIVEVETVLVGTGHAVHPHFIDSYRTWL